MSRNSYEAYKSNKVTESGLRPVTFKPEELGLFTFYSILAGFGAGLIDSSLLMGFIFLIIGVAGIIYVLAKTKEESKNV